MSVNSRCRIRSADAERASSDRGTAKDGFGVCATVAHERRGALPRRTVVSCRSEGHAAMLACAAVFGVRRGAGDLMFRPDRDGRATTSQLP